MAETVETTNEDAKEVNQYLEDSFKLFGIFRIPWTDIKDLPEDERTFLLDKAEAIESEVKRQQEVQQAAAQQVANQMGPGGQSNIITPDQLAGAPDMKLQGFPLIIYDSEDDEEREKRLREVARCFVSCAKNLPKKEAEQLAYETFKLIEVSTEFIKHIKKKIKE